jgi:hypothetical protein
LSVAENPWLYSGVMKTFATKEAPFAAPYARTPTRTSSASAWGTAATSPCCRRGGRCNHLVGRFRPADPVPPDRSHSRLVRTTSSIRRRNKCHTWPGGRVGPLGVVAPGGLWASERVRSACSGGAIAIPADLEHAYRTLAGVFLNHRGGVELGGGTDPVSLDQAVCGTGEDVDLRPAQAVCPLISATAERPGEIFDNLVGQLPRTWP